MASANSTDGQAEQVVPQAPLGQFEVIVDVADLDRRPFPPIPLLQIAANQFDVGLFDANPAVGQIDDVEPFVAA